MDNLLITMASAVSRVTDYVGAVAMVGRQRWY